MLRIVGILAVGVFLTSCSNDYPIHNIPPKKTFVLKEKSTKTEPSFSIKEDISMDGSSYKFFDEDSGNYDQIRSEEEFRDICFTYDGAYIGTLSRYSLRCNFRNKYRGRFKSYVCHKNMIFSYKSFEKLRRACRRFKEEQGLGSIK